MTTGEALDTPRREPKRLGPLRGVYVRGTTAGGRAFPRLLDRLAARRMNAVVLDAKDYDGWLTYPSRVPLARAVGAVKDPPIADLEATIAMAHARAIRVVVRIACFEDEIVAKHRPGLSVQSKAGRAYPIGWLDPSHPEAQGYVLDLMREALAAGADEIELDYVRYPVLGIKNADFHLGERGLSQTDVITDFVRRAHKLTASRGVPLSLDIFGVVAFGKREDIDRLGQDPARLAAECEALSPMVYPSHYAPGFAGLEVPGDHPELVGMAVRALVRQIDHVPRRAVIRPWLQAMRHESPAFSPGYVVREIRSSDEAGGEGWLMWNPGQDYGATWQAVPAARAPK